MNRLALTAAICGPVVATLLVFAPALQGGLLSDDYLIDVLRDRGTGGADWAAVAADFTRPWLGFEAPFYRPLLSVSFGVDLARAGTARALHETNLLLHLLTVAAAAGLCALHAPGRRAVAALLGGLLVGLHPVVVEPVAWIAARNSGLEVAVRTLALLAFALHLRTGRRGWLGASLGCAALALCVKESALILPVSLFALDLLHRPGRPLAERLRLHGAFVPLWVGYFALRRALLGTFVGSPGGTDAATDPAALLAIAGDKLHALVAPHTALDGVEPAALASLAPIACGVLLMLGLATRPWRVLAAALWLLLHAAPTFALPLADGLGGSRMIYGALPALAVLLVALPLDRGAGLRAPTGLLALGAALAVVAFAPSTERRRHAYRAAWAQMAAAEQGIAARLPDRPPAAPLAIASMPQPRGGGVPPCNPNAWFPFAERPVQDRDAPLVSLGFVTVAVPGSEDLLGDAGPIRAVRRHGALLLSWDDGRGGFRARGPQPPPTALPALRRAGPGRFRFARPVDAEAVAVVRITCAVRPAPAAGLLRLDTALGDSQAALTGIPFGPGEVAADDRRATYHIDLTRGLGPPALASVGIPLRGFRVEFDGAAAGAIETVAVEAVATLPALPPPFAAPDRAWTPAELATAVRTPGASSLAPDAVLRLVILDPMSAHAVTLQPGRALEALPERVAKDLDVAARLSRTATAWCYLEARSPQGRAGHARSPLRRVRLAPAPR